MKDLKVFLEGRTVDEITVKDVNSNKIVDVIYYCYDKESLDKLSKQYDKGFFLASLKNKSTWVTDINKEFKLNTWQPNGEYFKCGNKSYTYKELIELLEKGETMLIVINK